ncbi:hypothetical protein BU17DRAFT_87822 [Hysterangium stoloniferum]|nr:hypothetical protein BU17DRAFT_87822 [Hysterangium stoloniferum]
MVSSFSEVPTEALGNIILNAQIYAAPGQADRLQELLSEISKHAKSDAEPDCLEYRTTRSFVTEGIIKFAVWEVYRNPAALKTHFESEPFGKLLAGVQTGDLLDKPPTVEYFYEF